MIDKPMVAAITAAVNSYIEMERKAPVGASPIYTISPWKQFGRQELMRQRTMMQRKTGRRSR